MSNAYQERPIQDLIAPAKPGESLDIADRLLATLAHYEIPDILGLFSPEVQQEIIKSRAAMRKIFRRGEGSIIRRVFAGDPQNCVRSQDPKTRDQALWSLVDRNADELGLVIKSFETAQTARARMSALIGLRKLSHHGLARARDFFSAIAQDRTDIDSAEWAELCLRELAFDSPGGRENLGMPVSDREAVTLEGRQFDLTMPLHFECRAVTTLANARVRTVISPYWFSQVFGNAMALINQGSFSSNLTLEKQVEGLHADGSMHYEHFPFTGETTDLGQDLHLHNYWAETARPFYSSGTTEVVDDAHPALVGVPMTFFRMAMTATPEKYRSAKGPMPESVRGIFFGFGDIRPETLLARAGRIGVGDFQIAPAINPATDRPSNTVYYGTFWGKLTDTDEQGRLVTNKRDVHCDADGKLDFHGDGTYAPDPIRPNDW
jgi:hypothetical protein